MRNYGQIPLTWGTRGETDKLNPLLKVLQLNQVQRSAYFVLNYK